MRLKESPVLDGRMVRDQFLTSRLLSDELRLIRSLVGGQGPRVYRQ